MVGGPSAAGAPRDEATGGPECEVALRLGSKLLGEPAVFEDVVWGSFNRDEPIAGFEAGSRCPSVALLVPCIVLPPADSSPSRKCDAVEWKLIEVSALFEGTVITGIVGAFLNEDAVSVWDSTNR